MWKRSVCSAPWRPCPKSIGWRSFGCWSSTRRRDCPQVLIAERLSLAPATLSFHLKELSHAGLIASRQDGRFIGYRADLAAMNGLVGYLTENSLPRQNRPPCRMRARRRATTRCGSVAYPTQKEIRMNRFHVHLGVVNLEQSIRFYSGLFGAPPTVQKDDYAKWMIEDPRINFAISTRGGELGVNHLGLQADSADDLAGIRERFAAADQASLRDEPGTNCCYAKSDKHWVTDPQGIPWEGYHTLGEVRYFNSDGAEANAASACCTPAQEMAIPSQGSCCMPAQATASAGHASIAAPATACCTPAQGNSTSKPTARCCG